LLYISSGAGAGAGTRWVKQKRILGLRQAKVQMGEDDEGEEVRGVEGVERCEV
jgi:hypothetical protein